MRHGRRVAAVLSDGQRPSGGAVTSFFRRGRVAVNGSFWEVAALGYDFDGFDPQWTRAYRRLMPLSLELRAGAVQYLTDFECELGLSDWLLQEIDPFIQSSLVNHCIPRIACHVQNIEMRSYLLGTPSQLATVYPGHNDVC